jgi:hypothetical protein
MLLVVDIYNVNNMQLNCSNVNTGLYVIVHWSTSINIGNYPFLSHERFQHVCFHTCPGGLRRDFTPPLSVQHLIQEDVALPVLRHR